MTNGTSATGPTITSPVVMGGEAPAQPQTSDNNQPIVTENNPEPTPSVAPAPAPTPEVAPAPAPAQPNEPSPAVAPEPAPEPAGVQKRINEITAKRYEAERTAAAAKAAEDKVKAENAELKKLLAAKTTPDDPNKSAPPTPTQEEIDQMVAERAAQIAANAAFNKACNTIAEDGKKEYKDWDESLKNLGLVGAVGQNVAPDFLETAIELQAPHKVLHYLGSNLEEAERIVKLPPKKMALEMGRIEAKLNAPAAPTPPVPVSTAPAPVIPIAGAAKVGAISLDDPNITTEQFMELRAKQREEKNKRYTRAN